MRVGWTSTSGEKTCSITAQWKPVRSCKMTMAAVSAIQALEKKELRYRSLQSHFGDIHISFLLTVL